MTTATKTTTTLIKSKSKYHLKLIDRVHKEEMAKNKLHVETCELTRAAFTRCIKEIAEELSFSENLTDALDILRLRTINQSVEEVRVVKKQNNNNNKNIGFVLDQNQYKILCRKSKKRKKTKSFKSDDKSNNNGGSVNINNSSSSIIPFSKMVEIVLKGNFGTKDRAICALVRKK